MNNIRSLFIALLLICSAFGAEAQRDKLMKADKYYDLYAFNLAIDYYLDYLKSGDENTLAIIRLADCYRYVENLDRAIFWYNKAVNRPDRTPASVFNYAVVLKSNARYDEAKKWFNEYARIKLLSKEDRDKGIQFAKSCDFAKANVDADPPYQITNEGVNTFTSDFAPAFYGNKVVYSSFRKDKIQATGTDALNKDSYNMLYISGFNSKGNLLESNLLRKDFKAQVNEGYVSYTSDLNTVAFVKNNNNFTNGVLPLTGSGVKMDIYFAKVESKDYWIEETSFLYNGAQYSTGWPYLSSDGKTIYFASNVRGGYGGYDIYKCTKKGNTWSEPVNLGPWVNTPGNEISPYIAGGNLYFASDWHFGFGGLDIFKSSKVDDNWKNVTNLGYGVNTARQDYEFIYDTKKRIGFFTSNRAGGNGKDDIYQVEW